MTTTFASPQDLLDAVGTDLGPTEPVTITQDQINKFAEATLDNQWIHVDTERAKAGPFGTPIAHGYLTMSLASHFLGATRPGSRTSRWASTTASTRCASRRRCRSARSCGAGARSSTPRRCPGGVQATTRITIEREGGDKPAAIVDTISRYLA